MSGWLIFWGVAWLLCAACTGAAASARGRDGAIWFLIGLVFGLFALIAVLIGGDRSET